MKRVCAVGLLLALGCGARSELIAPIIARGDGDGGGGGPDGIGGTACAFASTAVLATGTQQNMDVRTYGGYVYWNDGERIARIAKGGGAPTFVSSGPVDFGNYDVGPFGVYYVTHGSSAVMSDKGGEVVATLPGPIERIAAGENGLYVVAPDNAAEVLYAVPLGGGKPTVLTALSITTPKLSPYGEYPQGAYGLVVKGNFAYLSLIGFVPGASQIVAVDLASGTLTNLSIATLSLPVSSLAVDDQYVYFANYIGANAPPSIRRVPIAGGDAEAIVTTPNYCTSCSLPTPLAVSDARVYFPSDEFGTTLEAWPKPSGDAVAVSGPSHAGASLSGIATDDACVYWVALGDRQVYVAPR